MEYLSKEVKKLYQIKDSDFINWCLSNNKKKSNKNHQKEFIRYLRKSKLK